MDGWVDEHFWIDVIIYETFITGYNNPKLKMAHAMCERLNDYLEEIRECLLKPELEQLQSFRVLINDVLSNEQDSTSLNVVQHAMRMALEIKLSAFLSSNQKNDYLEDLAGYLETWADHLRGLARQPNFKNQAMRYINDMQEDIDYNYDDNYLKTNFRRMHAKLLQICLLF